jgi:hypothetical protein
MEYAEVEARIRATIDTHIALAKEYNTMMTDIENKSCIFYLEKQTAKPDAVDVRKLAVRVIYTVYAFFYCLNLGPSDKVKLEKIYMFEPYIKYILSTHIRRQYQKLHSLYLAEVVTYGKNLPKVDVDELRQIATDIGDYSKTLPSLKSLTAILLGALSIIGTVFGIFDIKFPLFAVTSQGSLVGGLALLFLIFNVAFAVTLSPFIAAFHFKRFLLKRNKSQDVGFVGSVLNPTQLYNSSIYRLEDQLFELVGGTKRKPKEIPIDIILRVAYGSLYTAYLSLTLLEPSEGTRLIFGVTVPNIIMVIVDMIMIFSLIVSVGSAYVWIPIKDYKERVKARLL